MAHSPEKRAKAVADYLSGMEWEAVAKKHGISISCLKNWIDQAQKKGVKSERKVKSKAVSLPTSEIRQQSRADRFNAKLETFLGATVDMLQAWAEVCSEKEFLRSNPEGANELGTTVLDRADRLISVIRPEEPEFREDPAAAS